MSAEEEEDKSPNVIMVNEEANETFARCMARKGAGPEIDWAVRDMAEELKTWGHHGGGQSKLILRSDGEAAITALRDQLARMIGGRTVVETSAKEEHQSNGVAEESARAVRRMTITLKTHHEERWSEDPRTTLHHTIDAQMGGHAAVPIPGRQGRESWIREEERQKMRYTHSLLWRRCGIRRQGRRRRGRSWKQSGDKAYGLGTQDHRTRHR